MRRFAVFHELAFNKCECHSFTEALKLQQQLREEDKSDEAVGGAKPVTHASDSIT